MLEPPHLADAALIDCLRTAYGLSIEGLTFLPLGADIDTAVYRAQAKDGVSYFVKLRRGHFLAATVTTPYWLHELGVQPIIVPHHTVDGAHWTRLPPFTVILYPFVVGESAWELPLTDQQWRELGVALRQMHQASIPAELRQSLPQENYSAQWRDRVQSYQSMAATQPFADPIAAQAALLLQTKATEITYLVSRAAALAQTLQQHAPTCVLCHGDLHAANLLIGEGGLWYMVDWDTLVFAPKERDLMFIGGGIGGVGEAWRDEHAAVHFYQGYGQTSLNYTALAYYRCERIVQDIAIYCDQLLLTTEGGDDRPVMLAQLASNFTPNGVVDIAYRTDQRRNSTTVGQ
jgi:spectinomycin phosphotransferase